MLLQKKERYELKQQRLKQMEEQFEESREVRQKRLEQKLLASDQNKSRTLQSLQKKMLGVSTRHFGVVARHREEDQQQLQRLYEQRKTFETALPRPSSKLSRSSSSSSSKSLFKGGAGSGAEV